MDDDDSLYRDDDSLYRDDQSLFDGEEEGIGFDGGNGTTRIAREDIRLMNVVRAMVMLCLLTFAVLSGECVFIISLISEENNFSEAYDDAAKVLTNTLYERISTKVWIAQSFAKELAISGHEGGSDWPLTTFSHYAERCSGPLHLSDSSAITFAPFVAASKRESWEEFAMTTYPLTSDSNSMINKIGDGNAKDISDEVRYHPTSRLASQGIYRFTDGIAETEESVVHGYFPLWQQAPTAIGQNSDELVGTMFNLMSNDARAAGLQSMLKSGGGSISSFLYEDSSGQDYAIFSAPRSAIYAPIHDFNQSSVSSSAMGVVEFEFLWEPLFKDVLKGLDLPIMLVIENRCTGEAFTLQVAGPKVTFVGEGDLRNDDVDGYTATNSSYEVFESLFLEHAVSPEAETDFCSYRVSYFPTGAFKKDHVTYRPDVYRGIVLGVFLLVACVFCFYDSLIERRQDKVIDAAAKSDAIVRSLFPSNIADRLYQEAHKAKPDGKDTWKNPNTETAGAQGSIIETPKNRLKNFMSGSPEDQAAETATLHNTYVDSEPIADLFPNTTILFADIAGFTGKETDIRSGLVLIVPLVRFTHFPPSFLSSSLE
jgi:hypothetical protein